MLQKFDPRNRDLIVNVNGKLTHPDAAGVSPFDSVVQGGDAVWEGLRLYEGLIFRLEQHLDRLVSPARALAFAHIPAREAIVTEIRRTLEANDMFDDVHIRLTLTRAATISREVGQLHVATAFFAKQQSQLLADLAKNPDDPVRRAELGRRIDAVFNNVISFSLVDEFGVLLLPNPQQIIGPLCQNDIARYVIAHSGDANAVYTPSTHFTRDGNKFDQHFDIIVKNPDGGFFFMGIHADTLQQLLKLHELPGHQLVSLSGDKALNEDLTVNTGLRSAMDLPPLKADEVAQLAASSTASAMPGRCSGNRSP